MTDVVIDGRAEAARLADEALRLADATIVNGKVVNANSMRRIIDNLANAIIYLVR